MINILKCLTLLLLLTTTTAFAEQKKVFADYEVHYAAMLTSDLTAEVARAYNIPRSGKRAFVMIHARKKLANGTASVPILIEGRVSNMLGQSRVMKWQQVIEEKSIYSLSHFPITNREWANFKITVKPENSLVSLPLEFKQQFYTD